MNGLPSFLDATSGSSIFGGYVPVQHGGPGLGGLLGQGLGAQLLGTLLTSQASGWLMGQGYVPTGFSSTNQNLYDQLRARDEQIRLRAAMERAKSVDQAQIEHSLRGAFSIARPGPLLPAEEALIARMATSGVAILPMLAPSAPQMTDSLFGTRGSASLLAAGMAQAGRFLPDARGITGGLTGRELGDVTEKVFHELYGPKARIDDMRGFGGAATGQLVAEMSMRGLLSERDLFSGQGNQKALDGKKVAERIKEMTGVVSAIRDVFGDMGRADAPISELVNGLEALTQGGLARLDKQRLERMVRETQQMAKISGVVMDAVFAMQGGLAQQAVAMGLDRAFAPGAVQGSLAFATAYGQTSAGAPGWRKPSKEDMLLIDQQLRLGAANSAVAQQAGAILRLGDDGALRPGSEAHKLYERLKARDASALQLLSPGDFQSLLARSGLSASAAATVLADQRANQEAVFHHGVGEWLRSSGRQSEIDARPLIEALMSQGAAPALTDALGREGADRIGKILADAVWKVSPEDLANPRKRTQALVDAAFAAMTPDDRAKLGATEETQRRTLAAAAGAAWANTDQMITDMPGTSRYGSGLGFVEAHHPRNLERARQVEAQAQARADVARTMSGFGQQGPLRRLMEEVSRGGADLRSLAARFLGGTDMADVLDTMADPLRELSVGSNAMVKIHAELEAIAADASLTPQQREEKSEPLRKQLAAARARAYELVHGQVMVTGTDSEKTLEEQAKAYGVTAQQVLRGHARVPQAVTDLARRQTGLERWLQLEGVTPDTAAKRQAWMGALLNEARRSPGGIDAALMAADASREELLALAQKEGKFKGLAVDDLSREDMQDLVKSARGGDLGGKGLQALQKLGKSAIDLLDRGDVSLQDYYQALKEELRRAQHITLSGDLELHERTARVKARGVSDPGPAPAPPAGGGGRP